MPVNYGKKHKAKRVPWACRRHGHLQSAHNGNLVIVQSRTCLRRGCGMETEFGRFSRTQAFVDMIEKALSESVSTAPFPIRSKSD